MAQTLQMIRANKPQPIDWDGPTGRRVGMQVQHWWDGDSCWYEGRINKYNPATEKHQIRYDDGYTEWIKVSEEPILVAAEVLSAAMDAQTSVFIPRLLLPTATLRLCIAMTHLPEHLPACRGGSDALP